MTQINYAITHLSRRQVQAKKAQSKAVFSLSTLETIVVESVGTADSWRIKRSGSWCIEQMSRFGLAVRR